MCREHKLACPNWCVSCYSALMINLICFADDKFLKFYSCSHKKCAKLLHLRACRDSLMFERDSAPTHKTCEMVEFLAWETLNFSFTLLSVDTMNIFYQRTRLSSPSKHQLRQASDTLWRQHYVTTSIKYLINSHILLNHFKLIFLWLQLVKISFKLVVIWVNYEKRKRGLFFVKHGVQDNVAAFSRAKLFDSSASLTAYCAVLLYDQLLSLTDVHQSVCSAYAQPWIIIQYSMMWHGTRPTQPKNWWVLSLPPPRRLCFCQTLSVCLFVCLFVCVSAR